MIKDYKATANFIANWIKDYTVKAGAKTLVLGLSGGIDSALCALLIQRAGLPLVCVNMPCHSSPSAYNRAKEFADEIGVKLLKVDLSEAHAVIYNQLTPQANYDWESKGSAGGLRSCLRAPTLSFVAHATNGLIVGTGNRSEDHITRYFQKFGDGCVDFSPIADLWKSEVYALFKFLAESRELDQSNFARPQMCSAAQAIYDAKPSADLWGADSGQEDEKELGLSYDEIEWGDREDTRTQRIEYDSVGIFSQEVPGIIFLDTEPKNHPQWATYSPHQQHIISKLHRMEKVSRHKSNPNMPVCMLRDQTKLVE